MNILLTGLATRFEQSSRILTANQQNLTEAQK